jgi:hypothetical protein
MLCGTLHTDRATHTSQTPDTVVILVQMTIALLFDQRNNIVRVCVVVHSSNLLFELHRNNLISSGARACQGIIFVLFRVRR